MGKKRGRRARGEGSVYHWAEKNLYVGKLRVAGKRKTVYGKTEAEIRDKIRKLQNDAAGGIIAGSKQLFGEFIDAWAEAQKARGAWRPNSVNRSKSAIRIHIKPQLGQLRLADIRDHHVEAFLDYLRKPDKEGKVMAPATQRRVFDVLKPALRHARKRKLIPFDPTETVAAPKIPEKQRPTLTEEQAKRFLAAIADSRLEALFVMAIITGCRQAELLALTWTAIDFERSTILINRALIWDDDAKQFIIGPPKTARGVRTIEIIPPLAAALHTHQKRMDHEQARWLKTNGTPRQDVHTGLVFANARNGGFIQRSNLRRSYERLRANAGIPAVTFHDLRHTCASILVDEGLEMHDISKQLGHSSTSFTAKTYVHLTSKSAERTAQAQAKAWKRISPT